MSQVLEVEKFDKDVVKFGVKFESNEHVPKQNSIIKIKNKDGIVVGRFEMHHYDGKNLQGAACFNTLAIKDKILVIDDKTLNPSQRKQRRGSVYNGLLNCYSSYYSTGNVENLPEGQIYLAVPVGYTIFNTPHLIVINGGHRLKSSLEASVKTGKHRWFNFNCEILIKSSTKKIAKSFIRSNTQNNMGANDKINAAVHSGDLEPIWKRFKNAEKRGLVGKYEIVSASVEYKEDKKNKLMFGSLLSYLIYGISGKNNIADVLKYGNEASQYAVDSFLKGYIIMCDTLGRKELLKNDCENYRVLTKAFNQTAARIILSMPIEKELIVKGRSKICYNLTEESWKTFLKSLLSRNGSGYWIREQIKSRSDAKGLTELWAKIQEHKMDIYGDNQRRVIPDSNFPKDINFDVMLHNGEESIFFD